MNQLTITVRGEVLTSNFDEWKLDLIAEIQAVNTELTTEAQFAHAQTDVKRFKVAEHSLKKAKESAIDQASDIQRLFTAIDEVSEAVRQVRLSLERQIKRRKLEIKEEFIRLGIANIQSYIKQQDADFQIIDHADYLDPGAFETVMKRRASITTLSTAIDNLCVRIMSQIDERAALVKDNATRLESLSIAHQTLFQDRSTMLALSPGQLDEIIDQRIEVLERQVEITSDKPDLEPAACDAEDQGSGVERDSRGEDDIRETHIKEAFALIVELSTTRAGADAFLREVESAYASNPLVRRFRLERI